MPPQTVLTDASDAELAGAVAENLFALFRAMADALHGELVEGDPLCYHHTFPSNPMFKGVWRARLPAAEVDTAIEETLSWFRAREAPYLFWWVGAPSEPDNLVERLQAHGLTMSTAGDPGMAADLHALDELSPLPAGLSIAHAEDRKALEDWRDVFCAAFDAPLPDGQAWVDATLQVGIARAPWRLYVGYLDNKPVATNILFSGAGVASVYGVATLPEARGKGIGSAIMRKPLGEAKAAGYRYAVLFATEMGLPVYQRMGFRRVHSNVGRYLWIDPG
jgi:ribosomal protein S18 acetylase RimI-like enzyme